ncbi:MAG TPA: hypothetical protein VIB48_01425 [Acidimicrobiia bacterium]|jgi:hypothetical protein
MGPVVTAERPARPQAAGARTSAAAHQAASRSRAVRLAIAVAWVVVIGLWMLLEAGHVWRRLRARMD